MKSISVWFLEQHPEDQHRISPFIDRLAQEIDAIWVRNKKVEYDADGGSAGVVARFNAEEVKNANLAGDLGCPTL